MQLSMPSSGSLQLSTTPSAVYDEQLGLAFTQNFVSLKYNVTAIEQADTDGYGPGYLLNGLSDAGYWYQVGISWHWPEIGGGYSPEFYMNYEVFNSRVRSVFPVSGGGGLTSLNGTVDNGDSVLLNLYFSNGNVVMYVYDWNTSASAKETYNAEGASNFVGQPSNYIGSNGFFTGLMTEWWHANAYYGDESNVVYSESDFAKSSAWMWADEFVPSNSSVLFAKHQLFSYSNTTQLQFFSTNGTVEASDAYDFYTGSSNQVPLTLSYKLLGGGTNFTAPTFVFWSFGKHLTEKLDSTPTAFYLDPGTVWSIDNPLLGSSAQEIWISNQNTNGTANSPLTINFNYYHQFLVTFNYTVISGSGYFPPSVTFRQYGANLTTSIGESVYADAQSQYSYENPLEGSNSIERLGAPATAIGTISDHTTLLLTYYDQLNSTVSYSVSGNGSGYSSPELTFTQYGSANSRTLTVTPTTFWIDRNTSWSVPETLAGSNSTERWQTFQLTGGKENTSAIISLIYYHQFLTTYSYTIVGGGNPPSPSIISESSGRMIRLTISTSQSSEWSDAGATFTYPYLLNNSSTERWISDQTLSSGKVSAPLNLNPSFEHQYYVIIGQNNHSGGLLSPNTGWYNAGQEIGVSATANPGWQFEYWNGSGEASYSGNNKLTTVAVDSPITEYAIFYPGITFKATFFGTISYGNNSNLVTVNGGASRTAYFQLNSSILLTANPWPFFFKFDGWSNGVNSTSPEVHIIATSPETIQANFNPQWINIMISIIGFAVAAVIIITFIRRRRKSLTLLNINKAMAIYNVFIIT